MSQNDERLHVLKMIQEGKITPEEGIALIDTLEESAADHPRASREDAPLSPTPATGKPGRWLRVRVTHMDTGKSRANIRVPLSMVTAGMKMGMKFTPEVEGLNLNTLSDAISSGTVGQIVDVYDDEDREHVEVYIE